MRQVRRTIGRCRNMVGAHATPYRNIICWQRTPNRHHTGHCQCLVISGMFWRNFQEINKIKHLVLLFLSIISYIRFSSCIFLHANVGKSMHGNVSDRLFEKTWQDRSDVFTVLYSSRRCPGNAEKFPQSATYPAHLCGTPGKVLGHVYARQNNQAMQNLRKHKTKLRKTYEHFWKRMLDHLCGHYRT